MMNAAAGCESARLFVASITVLLVVCDGWLMIVCVISQLQDEVGLTSTR